MSIGKKIALGAAWMMLMKFSIRLIGLVSTLILVRLLDPADFGIAAMAMTVVTAVQLLTMFGFDVAIIQNQNADKDDYNTAWTLNVALGLGAGLLLIALAYPAAGFYGRPELVAVYMALSLATIFQGLENIGLVDFRKHLHFDREFQFRVAVKVAAFIVTMLLAFTLRSYWALIIGTITARLAATVMSYVVHDFRPRWSLAAAGRIMTFSKWLFLNNIMHTLRTILPDLIVGRIAGARKLGLYTVSYEISNLPTSELIAPINRALLPGFSKVGDDQAAAGRTFLGVAGLLALLSLPMGLGIAVTAEHLTPVVLGEKWLDAAPVIEILALFGSIMAMQSPITMVIIALGRPRVVSLMSLAQLVFMLPIMVMLTRAHGVTGAASAMLIMSSLSLPTYYVIVGRILGIRFLEFVSAACRPLLASLLMFLAVRELTAHVDVSLTGLLLLVAAGGFVYTVAVLALWLACGRPEQSAERRVLASAQAVLGRLRRSRTPEPPAM
ncbi:MAG: lipopolysaccharide biosynthesis protein [Pseudomonadota bacterium]